MTTHVRYDTGMNLLSIQGQGALYALLILFICAVLVYGFRLALIGWRTMHKKLPPQKPRKKTNTPEPVYYIVEKKKRKATKTKTEYSEPKRIKFH